MAFTHGSKAKIYGNGYNLSPFLRNIQAPFTVDTAETSTFGNTFKTYTPGLTDGTLSADGIFDGATDAVDQVFSAALTSVTTDVFTVLVQGDTALGVAGYGFEATSTSYQVTAGIGDVSQVALQAQNNMGHERGVVLHMLGQETADGSESSIDQTASTTTGWSAYAQITDAAATLTTLKIEDSADDSIWADLTGGGFTTLTSQSAQRITGAQGATVRRYVRVTWDLTTDATFHVLFCRGTRP